MLVTPVGFRTCMAWCTAPLDTSFVFFRESRYLLFLTENYAALRILQQDLLINARNPPFVLFGSSFPKDMEYTQVYKQ